jgi:hypothetical protein
MVTSSALKEFVGHTVYCYNLVIIVLYYKIETCSYYCKQERLFSNNFLWWSEKVLLIEFR